MENINNVSIELSPLFGDGMVLQRDSKVKIWGKASPNEKIQIYFKDKTYQTAVNSDGNWEVELLHLSPGGPFTMELECGNEKKMIKDILVGDVWVLGGQSNMELTIARTLDLFWDEVQNAQYSNIRHFTVPQTYSFHGPQENINSGAWASVTPQEVYKFSAVGYFFARVISEKYDVPIGLIETAVGGTPAQAWLSESSLSRFHRFDDLLKQCKDDSYVKETQKSEEQRNNQWYNELYEKDQGFHEGAQPWFEQQYNDNDWNVIELPRSFRGTELEQIKGSIWLRKEIELTEEMLHGDAKLYLGTLVDGDDTYFNGVKVGNTGYQYPPRRYVVPGNLLKKGKNVIAVRLVVAHNVGAFIKDMPYKLLTNGYEIGLSGTWKYRIGATMEALPPTTFFQYMPTGVYNNMIYPLRNLAIKGVLWYQGESNTGAPNDYKELFQAVIEEWRNTWKIGEFPFIYVQLTNYEDPYNNSKESGWARLRDEQRRALSVPNTGMAVTIDVGEYNELHPQNKKAVGERLALWASNQAYGDQVVCSGPLYDRYQIDGNKIRIYFNYIGGGLVAKGEELRHFEICGNDGKFIEAEAIIEDNTVVVSSSEVKEPAAVRYAWADNPEIANLYNQEGLPASPFTTEKF